MKQPLSKQPDSAGRYAAVSDSLASLGGSKWAVHAQAHRLEDAGRDVIWLTIGEPDVPTPPDLVEAAAAAMRAGRTCYSSGAGEPTLRQALAERYGRSCGRAFSPSQILCFPGTQTALFAVMATLADESCEVLVGDPMYATYEGVITAAGAKMVPVPLSRERGFRMDAGALAARITPKSRAVLLNLFEPWLADRVVVVSSISKSHAAPGFRSGWCIGPEELCERVLPLSEVLLFGNQPFIADMTVQAVSKPSAVAPGMKRRYKARALKLAEAARGSGLLQCHTPDGGMFALVEVSALGMDGESFAFALLEETGVAVMPGESFGEGLAGWLRIALTVEDALFEEACRRLTAFAGSLAARAAGGAA
ncbi:MAG: pyridoxal phosphate-dependent aminotransferase [Limibacillus sp.]